MRKVVPATALMLLALAASGCSPCAGVLECSGPPNAAVDGSVVDPANGAAVADVAVTLIVRQSSRVDSATSRTNGRGLYELRTAPLPDVSAKISLRVAAPNLPSYLIDSLPCGPVTVRGDACVLSPIVPVPWVPIHARLSYRGSTDDRVLDVPVTFTRTGGAAWFGSSAATIIKSRTDSFGTARLFPENLRAASLDSVEGILTVDLGPVLGQSSVNPFIVHPTYSLSDRPVIVAKVGPSLSYRFAFEDSVTRLPAKGVEVRFERTGGIAVTPQIASALSDSTGAARPVVRPMARGTVTGTLTIKPSGGTETPAGAVTLATFDSDSTITAGRWRIGKTGKIYPIQPGTP